jgi:hypothetical protein
VFSHVGFFLAAHDPARATTGREMREQARLAHSDQS